ncbi:MAG TPA: amino acid ABC transporter permease [Gammaproteobacteria bacterium]|nr:amino acid ABC transporter permease [Gammaproteobacteria bacterium]
MLAMYQNVFPFLLQGLWQTFVISMLAIFFGSLVGAFVGLGRARGNRWTVRGFGAYVHMLRGTPFLVQIYIVYFVLPTTNLAVFQLTSFQAAVIALSLYTSTYVAEIVSAAIEAVPRGQNEAAQAHGFNGFQTLWYVVLPQSFKMMMPPMGGVYVLVIKNTAVLSVIGVTELVREANVSIQRFPSFILSVFLLVALMYFCYCYPVLRLTRWAEKKWGGLHLNV